MHGGINLISELGQGTTTTFWIPFNKSQSTKLGSPLIDARPVSKRSESDFLITRCRSAPQTVIGDSLQNATPPDHFNRKTSTGLEATPLGESSDDEPFQQEVDRKSVHILVVEDKYVVIPVLVRVRNQFADLSVAVLSTSRSLSRQLESSDFL